MSTALSVLFIFIGVSIAVWLVSFIMEALRPAPQAPRTLHWASDLPVESVEVGGDTLLYQDRQGSQPRPSPHAANATRPV